MQTIACTHKIYDEPFSIVWQAGRQAGVQIHIQRQPDTGDGTLFAKRLNNIYVHARKRYKEFGKSLNKKKIIWHKFSWRTRQLKPGSRMQHLSIFVGIIVIFIFHFQPISLARFFFVFHLHSLSGVVVCASVFRIPRARTFHSPSISLSLFLCLSSVFVSKYYKFYNKFSYLYYLREYFVWFS